MALTASFNATGCGVETIIVPSRGKCCDTVIWASPVPGGISIINISNSPQSVSVAICFIAE